MGRVNTAKEKTQATTAATIIKITKTKKKHVSEIHVKESVENSSILTRCESMRKERALVAHR